MTVVAFFCIYGKRGRLPWVKIHLETSKTDDLEKIGGNLHLRCISLSVEVGMKEELQRVKRKNPKHHLKTAPAIRTTAKLPKIHKIKLGRLSRRMEVPSYPGHSSRVPESLLKVVSHYFRK